MTPLYPVFTRFVEELTCTPEMLNNMPLADVPMAYFKCCKFIKLYGLKFPARAVMFQV